MKRREFIQKSLSSLGCCAGLGLYSASGMMRLAQAAINQQSSCPDGDYKALVCIFLFGGNDSFNTIVPRGNTNYATYAETRRELAIAQNSLLAINPLISDGAQYGLHPSLPELQSLFNTGKIAVVSNVGTLLAPTSKAQYQAGGNLPPNLFAHDTQQGLWQLRDSSNSVGLGWGGLIADLLASQNSAQQLTNITLSGANTFQVGAQVNPYSIDASNGTIGLDISTNSTLATAYASILDASHAHILERAYGTIQRRAIDTHTIVGSVLDSQPALTTVFPSTNLAAQLKMAARLIQARTTLGVKRQTFFIGLGGFDTHPTQASSHSSNLLQLSQALNAFNQATAELCVEPNVTTFTMSDFGRTLNVNANLGTDHGWGGHHFVMGGAVAGQHIYGTMPNLTIEGPDDTGHGAVIPTLATDQYAATLARWFGVSDTNLNTIFPNLGNFSTSDLGFMA